MQGALNRPPDLGWVGAIAIPIAALALIGSWMLSGKLVLAIVVGLALIAAILRFPIVAPIALAFTIPWTSGTSLTGGSVPLSPTEVVVGALGAAWIIELALERRNPFRSVPWAGFVVLFIVVILISVSQSTDVRASGREVIKWAEMLVVYLAVLPLVRVPRNARLVLAAMVLGGVSQAVLGFLQLAANHGPAAFASERLLLRAYGTFDQPNPYAGYLNMILPVAVGMALIATRGRARRRYWIAAIVIGGAILASESRGALLAGVIALAIVLGYQMPRLRQPFLLAVVAVLLVGLVSAFGFTIAPLERLLNAIGLGSVSFGTVNNSNFSAVERAAHWLAGVRMFNAHPLLGVGIGNYGAAYPMFHPRGWYASLEHAHNYYINIAAEAGIIGLAAYLLLAGSALWYSCSAMRRAYHPAYRAAGFGATGALIATSFHNLVDVLYVHGTTALIGLLMALVTAGFAAGPQRFPTDTLPVSSNDSV
ncbi:MAG: O-antigen ligase family protein [Chloroflexota bacterium]